MVFNNISVISWWSVLLVEEIRVNRKKHRPVTRHRQTLSHRKPENCFCPHEYLL